LSGTPTIWEIESHTLAKHSILEEYLKAWFPILTKWNDRIVYLDGFAGPGVYRGGEEGSPLIAIRTALDANILNPNSKITFLFIDNDQARTTVLRQILTDRITLPNNMTYEVITANFADELNQTLDGIEQDGHNLAPTFAFIDPFGYGGFPMELVTRLLNYRSCEVLITFMDGFVNRFLDPSHENTVNGLFGTDEWQQARQIPTTTRRIDFLLELYNNQLKTRVGTKFVRTFRMTDENERIIYDLIFATKHPKGMEVMKKAMEKVMSKGNYRFSDRSTPGQSVMLDFIDKDWQVKDGADRVFDKFRGQKVSSGVIRDFVLGETPHRLWRPFLAYLEKQNPTKIVFVSDRKRNTLTYKDGCIVEFAK